MIDEPGRGRACTITWSYPEAVREHLVRPAHYTRILLEISSQMRSYAASVLYELGARYLTSPGQLTMREDVLWWASVLTGRSDITKVDYRIFHRDTIKKALAELDTLSEDFRMEVVEHKRGRKVEELQFRVITKPKLVQEGSASQSAAVFDLELVERIVSVGIKRSDAEDLYAASDEMVLRAAVDHVEQRGKSDNLPPLKSPKAYLRDALKKQYAGVAEGEAKLAEPPVPPTPSLQEKLQRLREEWVHHKAMEARARFLAMDQFERDACLVRFEVERLPEVASPIAKAWRRDGIDSRIAGSTFNRWLSGVLWPGDVTDSDLLNFAVSRQT